jgi:hypothetical protein
VREFSHEIAVPFRERVEVRLHPDDVGYLTGQPSGNATMRGWFRLNDDEPIDTIAVVQATDSFPPTLFNTNLAFGWVPTVELTAHLRARPVGPWLRGRFTTRYITAGVLEEDGELWDTDGRLVALSRQMALAPLEPQ